MWIFWTHGNCLDHSTRDHAEKAIKRRSPTLNKLIVQFNKLQKKLSSQKKPTPHAIVPPPIDSKGLHKLDVDADIWLNFDVDEETLAEFGGQIPPWLGDEKVRKGIRFMQEVVNCREEIARCQQELAAMQTWFRDECAAHEYAAQYISGISNYPSQLTIADLIFLLDPNLKHAITTKFAQLQELGAVWRTATASLPSDHIRPWTQLPPVRALGSHTRSRSAILLSNTNRLKDDNGDFAAESSDDDSTNSVDGELDPTLEVDITIGDAIDHDALRME